MVFPKDQLTGVESFIRSGDGVMFVELTKPDGEYEYVEAPKGLNYIELPSGKFMIGRDGATLLSQKRSDSHIDYFQKLADEKEPAEVRQNMRRQNALQRRLAATAVDRASPVGIPQVRFIKDEQYDDYHLKYREACLQGAEKQSDFQPVSTYARKLTTTSGRVVRPLYAGEVGMYGTDILCLEPGAELKEAAHDDERGSGTD
jgi:hypothetical protein